MKISLKFFIIMLLILAVIPIFVRNEYTLHIFIMAFIWCIVVSAWDLIMGYAGVFSFGQIAFFVIGAYASGMLTMHSALSPWLGILAGGTLAALVGVGIGLPCLRIKGVYIALVTYGLHLVLPTLILRGGPIGTGGSGGLVGIPSLQIGSFSFSMVDKIPWYYTTLVLFFVLTYIIYFRIIQSTPGLAFRALRDSEPFAKSLGVNEYKYKLLAFGLSAFFTGIAGAFYAHYTGSVSYRLLGMDFFIMVMVMLTFGGIGRYPGAIVGAFTITFANEFLREIDKFRLITLGVIVILTIIFMPEGIVKAFELVKNRWMSRKRAWR